MRLTTLGTGSPEAYARRASSGYLLEVAGQKLLFDCGGGVMDRLLKAGHMPSDIDALFFSHLHSDHMFDYARLVHARWDEGGKPLPVFGPAPIAEIHERFFGPEGALAFDLAARTELKGSQEVWVARGGTLPRPWPKADITEITPGFSHQGNGWRLTSCEVPHAQPHLTCMAFAVEAGGRKIVYSGDAGITPALEEFVGGADLLLHWCYRLADQTDVSDFFKTVAPVPTEIGAMAARAGVQKLVLTHFRVHMDEPTRFQGALQGLKDSFPGPSCIAEDLDVFEIGGQGD